MLMSWGRRGGAAGNQHVAPHLVVLGISEDMANTFTIGRSWPSCEDSAEYLH
jgi:hypothetical protein